MSIEEYNPKLDPDYPCNYCEQNCIYQDPCLNCSLEKEYLEKKTVKCPSCGIIFKK